LSINLDSLLPVSGTLRGAIGDCLTMASTRIKSETPVVCIQYPDDRIVGAIAVNALPGKHLGKLLEANDHASSHP
jgi:hypothetical protein